MKLENAIKLTDETAFLSVSAIIRLTSELFAFIVNERSKKNLHSKTRESQSDWFDLDSG